MASTIRIKRSSVQGNPGTLAAGELAYSALPATGIHITDGDRLYVGMGTETLGNAANHIVIGGKYFTDMLDQTPGTLTSSSAIVVDSNSTIDRLYVGNIGMDTNSIVTTNADSNLDLNGNGSGKVSFYGNAYRFPNTDGATGYALVTDGAGNISWGSVAALSATTATNLTAGTVGQVPYQTGPGLTSFYGPGTAGQLLVSGGAAIPVYTNTASVYVGRATTGDKWTIARTVTFTGDTTGTFSIDGSANVSSVNLTIQPNSVALGTDTTGDYVSNGATSGYGISGSTTGETQTFTVTANSTSANTVSTIVFRDDAGNFSAGTVAATSVTATYSYAKLANIEGALNVYQTGTTFTPFLPSLGRFVTDVNNYSQVYNQNKNNGTEASADFVVYNDLGTGTAYYLDMGINSSNYSSATYPLFPANSSYLLAGGGSGTPGEVAHLYLGAGSTSSDLVFFAGGLETSHVRAAIHGDTGNFLIGTTTDVTGERLQVAGTATISRDLFVAGAVYSTSTITAPRQLATKQYVDQQAASGIHIHPSVRVEAHLALTAVYAVGGTAHTITSITSGTNMVMSAPHSLLVNDQIVFDSTVYGVTSSTAYYVAHIPTSSSIQISDVYGGAELTTLTDGTGYTLTSRANYGVGATITNTGTQARLVISGITLNDNDRVLVDDQLAGRENGVYVVSNTGTVSTNWVLTRATDENKYSPADPLGMSAGDYFYISEGTPGAGESYVLTTSGDIIPGVTNVVFTLFNAAVTYNVIAPLDLTGNTLSLAGVVGATHGGTNVSSVATGDLLYGSAANTWGNLALGSAYKSLMVNAGGTQLEWNAVALNQAGAVSGQLPVGSGGTGAATSATARTNLGLAIGTDIPSLTGTGASGTWGIDITGAASTATHLAGGTANQFAYQTAAGRTGFLSTASIYVGAAASANNLFGGTANQFAYQSSAGVTAFISTASMYVGSAALAVNLVNGGNGALHYQSAPNTTSFLSTGTPGQVLLAAVGAPVFTTTGSIYVGAATSANNLFGGTANQFHYQTGPGVTAFMSTASMYVGAATSANNLFGGTTGQIPYQQSAGQTNFLSTGSIQVGSATSSTNLFGGTANQFAYQTSAGITSFASTGSMFVGASTTATNLVGGAAGSIPQQTAAGITSLLALGAAGKVLQVSTNTSAVVWGDIDGGTY
jgi:hypothetical protein